MIYVIMLILVYFLHLLLKLNWIITGILVAYFMLAIQLHRSYYREKLRQETRFRDVTIYMDTLLYSFLKEEKIVRAFESAYETLEEGELKKLVEKALSHMLLTFDDSEVIGDALLLIEEKYKCSRLINIHKFMLHVEYYGGEIDQAVNLLLDDKNRWQDRIAGAKTERKQMLTQIILSVIASLLICGVILYLPVMNVDISGNIIVQLLSLIVIILDDFIVLRAQKKQCVDWLLLDLLDDEEYYRKKMRDYREYNRAKDIRLSIILSVIPAGLCLFAAYYGKQWALAGGLFLLVICINQHRIGRGLARRNLTRYIRSAFPKWLLDIALLLQSENVHMALEKSRDQVPAVLQADLEELVAKLELDPESAEPYHGFLREFDLPEVHSAVGMLYSISMGNSGSGQRQIGELISRNLEMLDLADRERLHNKNSSMYLLFLAPVLTASFKLVTDMAVFLLTFLTVKVS